MVSLFAKAALAAALVAGVAVSVLQQGTTTPLILEAERYEVAADAPGASAGAHHHGASGPRAETAAETVAWGPRDGLERTLFTSLSAIGMTFGFALILLALMVLSRARIDARSGLAWGLAAFAATGLAPALGLAPELPGSAAAELTSRQMWWAGTAISTAAGLFLVVRVSTPAAITAGLGLLVVPHLIGAPHPDALTSGVPSELSGRFAAASLVVHAVAWSLTGVVAGYVWRRLGEREDPTPA
jgi:cobalt transporter subunit CbtA